MKVMKVGMEELVNAIENMGISETVDIGIAFVHAGKDASGNAIVVIAGANGDGAIIR